MWNPDKLIRDNNPVVLSLTTNNFSSEIDSRKDISPRQKNLLNGAIRFYLKEIAKRLLVVTKKELSKLKKKFPRMVLNGKSCHLVVDEQGFIAIKELPVIIQKLIRFFRPIQIG